MLFFFVFQIFVLMLRFSLSLFVVRHHTHLNISNLLDNCINFSLLLVIPADSLSYSIICERWCRRLTPVLAVITFFKIWSFLFPWLTFYQHHYQSQLIPADFSLFLVLSYCYVPLILL